MKKCLKCRKVKLLIQFSKDKRNKDGCGAKCVSCDRNRCKNQRLNNVEHYRVLAKKRRQTWRKIHGVFPSIWKWKPTIGYKAMHIALTRHFGSSRTFICPCGLPASGWALNPNTPTENLIVDVHTKHHKGHIFSMFFSDYIAKCLSCNIADGHPQLEGWTQRLIELGRTSVPLKGTSHV